MLKPAITYFVALAGRLQRHEHASGVRRTLSAGKSHHFINRRVFQNNSYILLHLATQSGESNVLFGLDAAAQTSCILLREETFRRVDKKTNAQEHGSDGHQKREWLMAQHPAQAYRYKSSG